MKTLLGLAAIAALALALPASAAEHPVKKPTAKTHAAAATSGSTAMAAGGMSAAAKKETARKGKP